MENARWNGRDLTASEVSSDYLLEKEVRMASGRRELLCPDEACGSAVLRYCHGERKEAYFAHLNNVHCDYADFDRGNSEALKAVRRKIADQLRGRGFGVQLEVKLLAHHYTHLLISLACGRRLPVEIETRRISANRIEQLSQAYREKGFETQWIVVDAMNPELREDRTYFLKRYLLNESKNRDLLVIGWDAKTVAQYRAASVLPVRARAGLLRDAGTGRSGVGSAAGGLASALATVIYSEQCPLDSLAIEGESLTIAGFHSRQKAWLASRERALDAEARDLSRRLAQRQLLDMQKQQRMEREQADPVERRLFEETRMALARAPKVGSGWGAVQRPAVREPLPRRDAGAEHPAGIASVSVEASSDASAIPEEVAGLLSQQEQPARDRTGRRWVVCEGCGLIGPEEAFMSFGGAHRANQGICCDCGKG